MKFKQLFIIALATLASTMFVACSSDDVDPEILPQEGKVNYFEKAIDFTSSGGSVSVCFSTNVDWTLTASSTQGGTTWCNVSQSSGKAGSFSVVVTAEPNTDYDARSIVLTLTAKDLVKTITVNQKKKDTIIIDKNSFIVSMDSVTFDVEVKANVDYVVEIPTEYQSWISKTKTTRGLTTKRVSFTVTKNEEYDGREGEVYFKFNDIKETLKISQNGGAIIVLLQNYYYVPGSESTIYVQLQSNIDYTVSVNSDWITETPTRGLSSSTKTFKIGANGTGMNRTGSVTFTSSDGTKSVTIYVNQAALILAKSIFIDIFDGGSNLCWAKIGQDYEAFITTYPENANTLIEWSVENPDLASITVEDNHTFIHVKNYGKIYISATDKYSGKKSATDFNTYLSNFKFTDTSKRYQFGYPVITLELGKTHQLRYTCVPDYATNVFSDLSIFRFKEPLYSDQYYSVSQPSTVDIV